jgi:hypothetical protein
MVIIALIILYDISYPQKRNEYDTSGVVLNTITQIVHSNFGDDFIVGGYEILDSILVRDSTKDYSYTSTTDPYGTLEHCVIFWINRIHSETYYAATIEDQIDTTIVCIMKNDALIYNSGNLIKGTIDSMLCYYDLNKDGNVEIGIITEEFPKNNLSKLNLLNWNGANCTLINEIDSIGHSSILSSKTNLFDIFDINNDGIYEIRGCYPEIDEPGSGWFPENPSSTSPYITYGWDGIKYGYSPSIRQLAGYEFLPSNRMKLLVHATVTIEGNEFRYSYLFKSDSSSRQLIEYIYINDIDTIGTIAYHPWGGNFTWILNGYFWGKGTTNKNLLFQAGSEKSGAGFLSNKLPSLKSVYAQGFNIKGDVGDDERTDERIINDVVTNSYATRTIGPGSSLNPFVPLNFLDTLSGYTTQSRSLGWIKADTTATKYLGYFASAKTKLVQRDSASARIVLLQVLADVNVDSTSLLTSEAYALLRFNTEYLLEHLIFPLSLSLKTYLQGPYNTSTGLMNTTLRTSGTLASHFAGTPIPFNAVDSINIEIRNAASASASTIRKFAPAWLLADGTIRSFTDTTKSFVEFYAAAGNYYVVVRHRNHLAIMSAASVGLSSAGSNYDFTTAQTQAYGTNPMRQLTTGVFGLVGGDCSGSIPGVQDGSVDALDRNETMNRRYLSGYRTSDVNLDGNTDSLDRNITLNNRNLISQVP